MTKAHLVTVAKELSGNDVLVPLNNLVEIVGLGESNGTHERGIKVKEEDFYIPGRGEHLCG